MFADLHLHSIFSDGTDTPRELCDLALDHGVLVISITDHDAVGGVAQLLREPPPEGVSLIPGIEISTIYRYKMLHVLGYYIDIADRGLVRFMDEASQAKTESTRLNFERAREQGVFSYEWERVLAHNAGQQRISGVHVVGAMEADGYEVPGMGRWDMFRRYFWPERPDYLSCETFDGHDAIDAIAAAGGVPVIAHPKSIGDDDTVLELVRYGAQGIEVYHPSHTVEETARYLHMAEQLGVYISGGSDWHGRNSEARGTSFAGTGLPDGDYPLLKLMR